MDLEHFYPANNMIRLRLNANLPAVKGLIQSAPPLNDCFIAEINIKTNFEDLWKSLKVFTVNKILK